MRVAALPAAFTAAALLLVTSGPSSAAPVTSENLLQAQDSGAEWLLYLHRQHPVLLCKQKAALL